jgi:hypothetical protein
VLLYPAAQRNSIEQEAASIVARFRQRGPDDSVNLAETLAAHAAKLGSARLDSNTSWHRFVFESGVAREDLKRIGAMSANDWIAKKNDFVAENAVSGDAATKISGLFANRFVRTVAAVDALAKAGIVTMRDWRAKRWTIANEDDRSFIDRLVESGLQTTAVADVMHLIDDAVRKFGGAEKYLVPQAEVDDDFDAAAIAATSAPHAQTIPRFAASLPPWGMRCRAEPLARIELLLKNQCDSSYRGAHPFLALLSMPHQGKSLFLDTVANSRRLARAFAGPHGDAQLQRHLRREVPAAARVLHGRRGVP